MCLLLAAHRLHPRFDLAIAANRDESFARPTLAMHRWRESPQILAGRDLSAGGTWLGVDDRGRFAAVTNHHERSRTRPEQPSRGRLVADFLAGSDSPADYLRRLRMHATDFAGFNLLCADGESLWYASNRAATFARPLGAGLYGVSNHLLDTPWPKVERAKRALADWIDSGSSETAPLQSLLADDAPSSTADDLPFPASSGPFIRGDAYGTRSSTLVLRGAGRTLAVEDCFAPGGAAIGRQRFRLSA